MEVINKTQVKDFVLLAFSDFQQLQTLLFFVVLLTYIICVFGNTAIIILVRVDLSLHTPMYFFISIFAFLEIMFVSTTVPKLLANLITANRIITFHGCFAQLYIFNVLGVAECYLLAVMVFDRHLAINKPLQYSYIMSHVFCTVLASIPWLIGFLVVLYPTVITAQLEFCSRNELNHFFCDWGPLQKLACSNPALSVLSTSSTAVFDVVVPFILILGFYIHIIIMVTKIKSDAGKQKAFSTCSSHIIVASLFYGTAIIVYVRPNGNQHERFLALMYTVVTPVINPFIYTLRNRDVKGALRKISAQLVKPVK
ncbi:putative olfactory receptor 2B8 [Spea bombifrons]|uniref:putative olfactory receptor 2B8 n=1 Tax=Spea bombifrons TaxID=233779 RepID=UPI00234BDFCC|nr:putative olfactory receptor 2B8 [Spea bombifrons]